MSRYKNGKRTLIKWEIPDRAAVWVTFISGRRHSKQYVRQGMRLTYHTAKAVESEIWKMFRGSKEKLENGEFRWVYFQHPDKIETARIVNQIMRSRRGQPWNWRETYVLRHGSDSGCPMFQLALLLGRSKKELAERQRQLLSMEPPTIQDIQDKLKRKQNE